MGQIVEMPKPKGWRERLNDLIDHLGKREDIAGLLITSDVLSVRTNG